jgi:hypothetical protein
MERRVRHSNLLALLKKSLESKNQSAFHGITFATSVGGKEVANGAGFRIDGHSARKHLILLKNSLF